jgi:aminopeptidase N
MVWNFHLVGLVALALCACRTGSKRAEIAPAVDPHSFSEPDRVRVRHLALELDLDFVARIVKGVAQLELVRTDPAAPLVLDVLDLSIESVSGLDGKPRRWALGSPVNGLGTPLTVELLPADRAVRISYHTDPEAAALQWLAPEQTAGSAHPFLYTQGQAVLTRTWIPLQDTPRVRLTYEARVRAPQGLTPVMSAEQLGLQADGSFAFRMAQPIPAYLIALACGEIAFEAISRRAGVWAAPSLVRSARDELSDTERMIQVAENLFGPYRWGRYDVIVLPPAFPYGGMENPRLTFATPTILAGDRSLVALIAHELAHSWSGNLVTNATWGDFWLNEGFTVYLEQRIMEVVYGPERARMEQALDYETLRKELAELEPRDQVLQVDLRGRHPDDGFSNVPYMKGALFLRRLEQLVGRESFDRFLNQYFEAHAFQSMTTEAFVEFLQENLLAARPEVAAQIDLDAWLRAPGLPDDVPVPRSESLDAVDAERESWLAGKPLSSLATAGWVTQQWLRFLEGMPADLGARRMGELDRAFHFTDSGNSEIVCTWLRLSIAHGYSGADERLDSFLMNVGRRKYLAPLYKELVKTEAGREKARRIYAKARPRYHAVSTGTLDEILGWSG